MARIGRSFPAHPQIRRAAGSNVTVTLAVVSPVVSYVQKGSSKTLTVTSTVVPVLNGIKLKALQVLSVTSATIVTLTTVTGRGMILSVVSAINPTIIRGPGKVLSVASPALPQLIKRIGKFLGDTTGVIPIYSLRSRIILYNFDGGIAGTLSTNTLTTRSIVQILPGLFRIAPPKGAIKIQFRTFVIQIIKRIMTL